MDSKQENPKEQLRFTVKNTRVVPRTCTEQRISKVDRLFLRPLPSLQPLSLASSSESLKSFKLSDEGDYEIFSILSVAHV